MPQRSQFRETEESSKILGCEYKMAPWVLKSEKYSTRTPMALWFIVFCPFHSKIQSFYSYSICIMYYEPYEGQARGRVESQIQTCMTWTLMLSPSWFISQTKVQSGFWGINIRANSSDWKNGVQRLQREEKAWARSWKADILIQKNVSTVWFLLQLPSCLETFVFFLKITLVTIKSGLLLKISVHPDCL